MHVTRLDLRTFRRFSAVSLAPAPGVNVITGDNGAGKTSLLEALHLMAYGRSFRGRVREGLIAQGQPALEVYVEWCERASWQAPATLDESRSPFVGGKTRKGGLRHTGHSWTGRLDGSPVAQLGDLCAALAVVTFEPGSHALITGAGDQRRRFLDWGLFHVEPEFLSVWRRYNRALKQRNALLKLRQPDPQLDAWDQEIADSGEPLSQFRNSYVEALQPRFESLLNALAPMLGELQLGYHPGWRREDMSLADALLLARDRDLSAGYSSIGPHRGDWRLDLSEVPGRDALSRGQSKLVALAAILAQAEHHAELRGEWPVVALDDLASELDRRHQARVLARLAGTGAQVFITGTESPQSWNCRDLSDAVFHVEHGEVRAAGQTPG